MPVATILTSSERFELKSLPEGYVVIRRMSYGEKLKRQGMMTKYTMNLGNKKEDMQAEIDILQEKVSLWEFANLVVEHNLTDENERALNFKNQHDVYRLGPRVGEEIQRYIDSLNNFEDDDEVKN